jgi:hypothetical protein
VRSEQIRTKEDNPMKKAPAKKKAAKKAKKK